MAALFHPLFILIVLSVSLLSLSSSDEANRIDNQLVLQVILRNLNQSECPGTILTLSEAGGFDPQLLDQFMAAYDWPVILYHENVLNRSAIERETICTDAVLLDDWTARLLPVYRQLQLRYYLNRVTIVTDPAQGDIEHLLDEIKNEKVVLLLRQRPARPSATGPGRQERLDMLKWSVSSDRYLRIANVNGSDSLDDLALMDRQLKFSGRLLNVATLHFPPVVSVSTGPDGHHRLEGSEPSLLNLIAGQLNFTYRVVLADQGEMWGEMVTDGQTGRVRFTGIRGMLANRRVDIGFGDLYVNALWLPYMSFSQVYKTDYDCFLVPAPTPPPSWMALILPFPFGAWLAIVTSVLVVTALLRYVDGPGWTLVSFLFVLGQLLGVQQPAGPANHHRKRQTKKMGRLILIGCWLTTATILSTAYRSGLISYLTRPFQPQPIDTVQQLVQSPVGKMMYGDVYRQILMNSTDVYRRQLAHQIHTSYNISSMYGLMDSGHWAVNSAADNLNYFVASDKYRRRRLHVMREPLFPTRSAFALQLDSPLKPQLDNVIQRLIEAGLVEYHRSLSYGRHFVPKSAAKSAIIPDESDHSDRLVRFSIGDLQGAFYLLAIGLIVSVLAFLIELAVSKCRHCHKT